MVTSSKLNTPTGTVAVGTSRDASMPLPGQLSCSVYTLHALCGVQDTDDDVRAVAAEALVPVAPTLAQSSREVVAQLRGVLWDILLDLEELSPSTGPASAPKMLRLLTSGSASMCGLMGGQAEAACVKRSTGAAHSARVTIAGRLCIDVSRARGVDAGQR